MLLHSFVSLQWWLLVWDDTGASERQPTTWSLSYFQGFPEWCEVMNSWGGKMVSAVQTVAEMAAVGYGLPPDAFTSLMNLGPHLLAPTGADLHEFRTSQTVLAGNYCAICDDMKYDWLVDLSRYSRLLPHHPAICVFGSLQNVGMLCMPDLSDGLWSACTGFHYDLNFLTIHGKSRFPGLFVWLRNGQRVPVRVPDGCLLVQAGKQMEWLTGGHVQAGMHEVRAVGCSMSSCI